MKSLFVLFILLCFGFSTEKATGDKSLIVAEYRVDKSGVGGYTYLVSYNFRAGKFISKDTILGSRQEPDESIPWFHVRYDIGRNFIYRNRYVVSGTGHVIDLQTRSFLMKASDDFVEAKGDTLLFHRNNIWGGTGYLVLDLNARSYGFIADKNFGAAKGVHAPDHLHGIDVSYAQLRRQIILYDKNNTADTIVSDAGYGASMSPLSSSHGQVPVFWIDNSSFLYAEISRCNYYPKIPVSSATIRKVNIETKQNLIIGQIDSIPEAISNPKFWFDQDSVIVYSCKKGAYAIDTKNNRVVPYAFKKKIENGFYVNRENDKSRILYDDQPIGDFFCCEHRTTANYFAGEYALKAGDCGYPKGIKVWSTTTKEWITLDIPWVSAIIGWVDK